MGTDGHCSDYTSNTRRATGYRLQPGIFVHVFSTGYQKGGKRVSVVDSTEKLSCHPIMHRNRNLVGIHEVLCSIPGTANYVAHSNVK
jgi:hypothetical protein